MTTKVVRPDDICDVRYKVRWVSGALRGCGGAEMRPSVNETSLEYHLGGFARALAFSLNDGES